MTRRAGLTLGKFAPLHRGHQYMIETALAEVDQLILLIYDCPETTDVPLPVRANWIRSLYPMVEVIEAWGGPTEMGDTPEIKRAHEAYILSRLGGRRIAHFYSSEFYGEHVSQALGALNRQVDPRRLQVPVSGTLVRSNPYEHRGLVSPIVYRDLVTHVVFLGAPSTGKTTLCEALAQQYRTEWMPEYGREYWTAHQVDRRLTTEQLVELAEGHLLREEQKLSEAREYLFTDTNAITTYLFSLYYHGRAEEQLIRLAERATNRYDLVFFCGDEIPYDDTWDRSGAAHRATFQKQMKAFLLAHRVPFIPLSGNLTERMAQVSAVLGAFKKYQGLGSLVMK